MCGVGSQSWVEKRCGKLSVYRWYLSHESRWIILIADRDSKKKKKKKKKKEKRKGGSGIES